MTDGRSDMREVIDSAIAGTNPFAFEELNDVYGITLTNGGVHKLIDLESFHARPRRKRGSVSMFSHESLAAYVKDHSMAGTAMYADIENGTIVAVLNGHVQGSDEPGWGDLRATYMVRLTDEWGEWNAIDKTLMSQKRFAEFLEDHASSVVVPEAAELLELAQTFEATVGVEFQSAQRLDNGQRQLVYKETVAARAGQNGAITIPETIRLGLTPFEGAEPYSVHARFRYRINGSDLTLGIVLDQPDVVFRSAFGDVLDAVENIVEQTAYRGLPPA